MPKDNARVIFMGSPTFAVPTLEALAAAPDFDVVCVVSQPDRPQGRGKRVQPTAVKRCAISHGFRTEEMSKRNYHEMAATLSSLMPDFIVVAAFGIILKDDLLSLPARGCINLHASLLPRYRGVSPIQAAILAGETETGCTTMLMDAGIDTGDILLTARTQIGDDDTTGTLEDRLADLGAPLVVRTLRGIMEDKVHPAKQDDRLASYTKMIRKQHGRIDWKEPAVDIFRLVRAMRPWPTAYTGWDDRRVIVVEAAVTDGPYDHAEPGIVLSRSPLVVGTGDGALEIRRLKVAGKKEMSAAEFVSGYRARTGDRFA